MSGCGARQRGHTLLELLVVATLLGVLGVVFGLAGRFMSGETVRLRQRARVSAELHMAVEHLRQDLARAQKIGVREGGGLLIAKEASITGLEPDGGSGAYRIVEYVLKDDRLLRLESDRGRSSLAAMERKESPPESYVVAMRLGEFVVEQPDGYQTRIHLGAGVGLFARRVTLVWEP